MWKNLAKVLSNVAPTVATALGGPMAGGAVKLITQTLGLSDDALPEQIIDTIVSSDPATIERIKTLDYNYKTRMAELNVDLAALAQKDRQGARRREERVGGWSNPILATIVISGFFVTVAAVLSGYTDASTTTAATLIGTMLGYVSAKADQVISYYFGSSIGSQDKNRLLANSKPEG